MVQRYVATEDRQFKQLNNGPFVLYSDHAALEKRCKELVAENAELRERLEPIEAAYNTYKEYPTSAIVKRDAYDKAINQCMELKEGECYYCHGPLDNRGRGHLDHKTPLAKGGLHEISNLVFACSTCNLKKATKTAEEYLDIISR